MPPSALFVVAKEKGFDMPRHKTPAKHKGEIMTLQSVSPPRKRGRKPKEHPAAPVGLLCPRRCALCNSPTTGLDDCARHIIREHIDELKICPKCSRAFVDEDQFKEHQERHKTHSGVISCAHCPVHFKKTSLLEKHTFEKHETDTPGIVLFRYLPYLSGHLKTNFIRCMSRSGENYKIYCRVCPYSTEEIGEFLLHANTCTNDQYVCDRCNNVFRKKSHMARHIIKHCKGYKVVTFINEIKNPVCKNCNKSIMQNQMRQHLKVCKSYDCSKCAAKFKTIEEFNFHHLVDHNESLQIRNCPYCRMEFISKVLYEKHVEKHERYKCLKCFKMFRMPKPLLAHIKSSHRDVEPYKCVPCSLTFKDGFDFKTHITEHGSKGYIYFDNNFYVTFSFEPLKKDKAIEDVEHPEPGEIDCLNDTIDKDTDLESSSKHEITVDLDMVGITEKIDNEQERPDNSQVVQFISQNTENSEHIAANVQDDAGNLQISECTQESLDNTYEEVHFLEDAKNTQKDVHNTQEKVDYVADAENSQKKLDNHDKKVDFLEYAESTQKYVENSYDKVDCLEDTGNTQEKDDNIYEKVDYLEETENTQKDLEITYVKVDYLDDTENTEKDLEITHEKVDHLGETENTEMDSEITYVDYLEEDTENTQKEDTDVESPEKNVFAVNPNGRKLRPKRKRSVQVKLAEETQSDSDDDLLCVVREKVRKRKRVAKKACEDTKHFKKSLRCALCNKRSHDQVSYNRHINMHFKSGAKQCIHCAKILKNCQLLENHIKEVHSKAKPLNKLHEFLKARAQAKLIALKEAAAKKPPPQPKPLPAKEPFKIQLKRVAPPTYETILNGEIRTVSSKVNVTPFNGPIPKTSIGNLTLQKYVENFQPEETMQEKPLTTGKSLSIKPLTNNKSLKIRSVRCIHAKSMFKIHAKPFKVRTKESKKGLAMPHPFKVENKEKINVSIRVIDEIPTERKLDFGTKVVIDHENVYDADYFEADDHDSTVAQVEVSSTPVKKKVKKQVIKKSKGYMVEVSSGEPTTEEMETKLAEVCKKLELPVSQTALRIGQLTTSAPFYQIVNVKQAIKRQKQLKSQEDMKKRFEEIKIGDTKMVPVNPLAHLMANIKLPEKKPVPQSISVTPL